MANYLKPKEAAEHFSVSLYTVYRWIKQGRLGAENVGNGKRPTWRIPRSQLKVQPQALESRTEIEAIV